ncbi:hypothetical protein HQ550_01445, partial [bacterium]|nr:hypothetical protein [bacterium]
MPFTENLTELEAAEFGMSVDFLIQAGISFYDQGRVADAMSEFKKALIVNPNSIVAKEFLRQIENQLFGKEEDMGVSRALALEESLDRAELKKELLKGLSSEEQEELLMKESIGLEKEFLLEAPTKPEAKPIILERTIILGDEIRATQPSTLLEIEIDSSVLIKGDNIKRVLNTKSEKIKLTKQDPDNLLVTAVGIGKGIFHIWDNSGRWTFNFKGLQKRFIGAIQEEYERMVDPIGLSDPFKIIYSFNWSSFNSGRRIDETQRQSLSFNQSVAIRGETPYGLYDASINIRRLNKEYQLDNLTMGLTNGHVWDLEHINIRLFDYTSGLQGFKMPSADLRGFRINAPMFHNKLNYTAFWGGLPKGDYTHLPPGLGRTKEAYLEGIGLQYRLSNNAKYKLYYAHTYGSELSEPLFTDRAFGGGIFYKIGRLKFESEIANDDNAHISYTSSAALDLRKTKISLGFTEDDRDFASPFGGYPAGGSTSARFGINFYPTNDFSIRNSVTAKRDRAFYNPDDPKRPSYTFDTEASWRLDPHTNIDLGYNRNDTKGSISPALNQTRSIKLKKKLFFIKKLNSYFNYVNSTSKYFTGSTSNYDRNTFSGGVGFNVIGELYYSINKSINFIENRITDEHTKSHVLDTSLNYYSRIFDSPFYGRFRISFRDEEEAESVLSYLSGEDRLEFAAELDYRPNPYLDAYLSLRVANVWAENEGTTKHLDAEVRYGVRIVWDTGLRWNTKGHVEGFVFNDLNGDGVKDNEEEGIEGIVIEATTKK